MWNSLTFRSTKGLRLTPCYNGFSHSTMCSTTCLTEETWTVCQGHGLLMWSTLLLDNRSKTTSIRKSRRATTPWSRNVICLSKWTIKYTTPFTNPQTFQVSQTLRAVVLFRKLCLTLIIMYSGEWARRAYPQDRKQETTNQGWNWWLAREGIVDWPKCYFR